MGEVNLRAGIRSGRGCKKPFAQPTNETHDQSILQEFTGYYCFCSDMSYEQIISRQIERPLPPHEAVDRYTSCGEGCGTCIAILHDILLQIAKVQGS